MSITILIPNLFRKNGMARINSVSDTWDIDIIIVEYLTTTESAYFGKFSNSVIKTSPNAFVNCNAAPKNIEKTKNKAISKNHQNGLGKQKKTIFRMNLEKAPKSKFLKEGPARNSPKKIGFLLFFVFPSLFDLGPKVKNVWESQKNKKQSFLGDRRL